jgi:hypothetical protein
VLQYDVYMPVRLRPGMVPAVLGIPNPPIEVWPGITHKPLYPDLKREPGGIYHLQQVLLCSHRLSRIRRAEAPV